jgi:DNA processing protein
MGDDLLYKLALTQVPGVGPKTARSLIGYCGGVQAVFEASKKELSRIPGIGPQTAHQVHSFREFSWAEQEIQFIEKNGIQPLFYLDSAYPRRLTHLPDAPIMLYYKGNENLNQNRILAIVGTRQPSPRGKATCEELIDQLTEYQPLIVSGLAYGIDYTAHKKALQAGLPTIAVLGHGLDRIYPAAHRAVAYEMIDQGGLLSEFHSQTLPDREHFPMRNRIVAGMSDAVLVIETARKGGSMITAHLANDYHRDVFAVPGRIQDEQSSGCLHLIKTHKAALIEHADDLAYVLQWEKSNTPASVQTSLFPELSVLENKVLDLVRKNEEISLEKLIFETELVGSQLASILLQLEFKGLVRSLPGKRYMRL